MENLTLLNVYLVDNATESPSGCTIARIIKMTMFLLLMSFSGLSQTMKQVDEGKFIVSNLSENFDTSKQILIRTMMTINDSMMTNSIERYFKGSDSAKINFNSWGEYLVKFEQKQDNGDFKLVNFWVIYFANKRTITRSVGLTFSEPKSIRD